MLDIVTTENSRLDGAVAERSLLIVDDDRPFLSRPARAMECGDTRYHGRVPWARAWRRSGATRPVSPSSTCAFGIGNGFILLAEPERRRPDARGIA